MKEKQDDGYAHVLKYTSLFGSVQGLNILLGLLRNKIVAVLLGPSGMGLVSLFNTTVTFISQATNLGISFSAVRHVSELFDSGDERRIVHFVKVVRVWGLLTALLGMLVCMLLGPVLSNTVFNWGDHTLHFMMLAPAVGMLAVTGAETAILKGARRLKDLAATQLFLVFISLIVSIPLYYFYGQTAIVPVIVLMAFFSMLFTIRFSYRIYPLRLCGTKGVFGEGMEMVRLGVAFVLGGVLSSGVEMLIRAYLNVTGSLNDVGLYNVGYMITVSYAGLVFSAMETDYFPRLSAKCHDVQDANLTVNRQIEVSLLLLSPMLATLVIGLPVLIPLLFSGEFLPIVQMTQVAVFAMYMKAISLPISYLTLARGESLAFLLLEAAFDVTVVLLVIWGYHYQGLYGTGVALSAAYFLEFLLVYFYAHSHFGYRMSSQVAQYAAIQLPLGLAVYMVTLIDNPVIYWILGPLLCFVSLAVSVHILKQKTLLWSSLKNKVLKGNND